MSIKTLVFPEQSRGFKGKRWVDVILRTIHLVGLLGIAGGILFQAPESQWYIYFLTTILSGIAMISISIWSNGKWMLQNRGLAIIVKFSLLLLIPTFPNLALQILIIVVIISGISSHAPARFRYYSPFYGKEI